MEDPKSKKANWRLIFSVLGGFVFYFFLTSVFIGVVMDATYTQGYSYGGPQMKDIIQIAFGNSFWICFCSGIGGALKGWWSVSRTK